MKADENRTAEELLENIELPKNLNQLVADSVEEGYRRMKRKKELKRKSMMKRAAVIVGIAAAGTAVSFPVRAFVTSFVQERMEQIPQEELTEELKNLDAQQVGADTFSRVYTDGEKERMGSLNQAYSQGTFPQKELRQEKTADRNIFGELYFAQDTSTFYLPERELTDEEILQIIDFNTKRDYALTQKYEQDGKKGKQEEQEAQKKLEAAGGLTEEQAKELGRGWLLKLYGETGDGMELNFYLEEEYSLSDGPVYMIGYSLRSVRNSMVVLNAEDGSLVDTSGMVVADEMDTVVSTADVLKKTDALYREAKETLTDRLGMEADYEKVMMAYNDADGRLGYMNGVTFLFVKADGSAHELTMSAVRGTMMSYRKRENWEDYKKEMDGRLADAVGEGSVVAEPEGKMVYQEMQK